MRADDRRKLLMGQSVLKIHKIGAQRFYPYGYFGLFDDEFAVPVNDEGYFDRFCRDFHVARGERPGLSVVIPFPDPDLAPHTIIPSIIRHYFVPIISGDLIVEVVHSGKSQLLDAETLSQYLAQASWDDAPQLIKLIDLARWGLTVLRDEYVRIAPQPELSAPRWAENCLDADTLAQVRERFNAGQRIAVSVPVWVKPASKQSVLSHFDVCLERDDTLAGSEEHFVRDGITIAGVRTSLQKSVRAIVIVREQPLSELLGDSENPSHTEWQERSPKFKDRYRHGPYTLRYVKNAPREIVRALMRPTEGRDLKLLQHLFSLDVPTENAVKDPRKGRQDAPGTDESKGPDGIETVAKDALIQLQKLNGGFRIVGVAKKLQSPESVVIWVAYEVRRGNPFKQYQVLDFEMDKPPIAVNAEGATVLLRQANVLQFRVDRPEFRLTVKGFDAHRDVRVKVLGSNEGSGT